MARKGRKKSRRSRKSSGLLKGSVRKMTAAAGVVAALAGGYYLGKKKA